MFYCRFDSTLHSCRYFRSTNALILILLLLLTFILQACTKRKLFNRVGAVFHVMPMHRIDRKSLSDSNAVKVSTLSWRDVGEETDIRRQGLLKKGLLEEEGIAL